MDGGEGAGAELKPGPHDTSGVVDACSGLSCSKLLLSWCAEQMLMAVRSKSARTQVSASILAAVGLSSLRR